MTIFSPSNTSRSRGNSFSAAQLAAEQRHADNLARLSDPTEQHIRFIRSRGYSIFRSSVSGGPDDRWRFCGRDIDAAEVAAEAERIRLLMVQKAAAAPPPPAPAPVPERFMFNPKVQPPAASSGIHPTAAPAKPAEQEHDMAKHEFEVKYCKDRETTPGRVRADMRTLKDRHGSTGAADILGIGKSTFGNALAGSAGLGPTVLTSLYGDYGCQLLPHLLASPAAAPSAVSADTAVTAEVAIPGSLAAAGTGDDEQIAREDALREEIANATPKADTEHALPATVILHDPASLPLRSTLDDIRVADLLATARQRRERLAAELAAIDGQIDAVMRLASPLSM